LEVEDNGPGIPAETLTTIFSPFFTTKSGTGRGLGLAIVQSVVSNLGGRVDVTSTVGSGARFRVILPRDATDSSDHTRADNPTAFPDASASSSRTLTVPVEPPALS